MRYLSQIATGMAGLALGLGVAAGGTAFAATSSSSNPSTTASTSTSASSSMHASPLKSRLDTLVKAGTITQAQENSILAKIGPGGSYGNHHRSGNQAWGRHKAGGQEQMLAKALGMTSTQVRADFAKGMTLQQIATSKGMTEHQLITALDKQADARVSTLVSQAWTKTMPTHHTNHPSTSTSTGTNAPTGTATPAPAA